MVESDSSSSCNSRSMACRLISRAISSRNASSAYKRLPEYHGCSDDFFVQQAAPVSGSPARVMVWAHQDLNLGPAGYEPAALNQAELWARANTANTSRVGQDQ